MLLFPRLVPEDEPYVQATIPDLLGYPTLPQVAQALNVSQNWFHIRIQDGRIQITKDTKTGLYLFPDRPETLKGLMQLKNHEIDN